MSSNDNAAVLTVTELAVRWKCDRHRVLEMIHDGRLRAFKLGKRAFRVALPEVLRCEKVEKVA